MTMHPRARAAQLCHSPKVAARETGLTQNEIRAIRDVQAARARARNYGMECDPLIIAARTRANRTMSQIAAYKAAAEARAAERAAEARRKALHQKRQAEIRETLLRAARVARSMGYKVRGSKDRAGRISSYYITLGAGTTLRISDHAIPQTEKREFMAREYGREFYNGYHGPEIIINQARRPQWLRRAIILARAGRI